MRRPYNNANAMQEHLIIPEQKKSNVDENWQKFVNTKAVEHYRGMK